MKKEWLIKTLALGIVVLFFILSVPSNISENIKIINKEAFKNLTNDKIEDIYGLKYDDRGYIIKNQLFKEDTNLVNTNNNGPGEINQVWIKNLNNDYFLRDIEIYKNQIYAACWNWDEDAEKYNMTICKYESNNGSLIWMKNWSSPDHPDTVAHSLNVYNDAIYIVGYVGPFHDIIWWMDSFIRKYDLDGNLIWSKIINETIFDEIDCIKVYENYLYLCGSRSVSNGWNAWILKYDTDGNRIWSKIYNIIGTMLGSFYDFTIYNGYIFTEGQTDSHDNTQQDVLVAKISLDGKLIWFREWGGKGPQLGCTLDVYNDNIYVCGYGNNVSSDWGLRDILLKYDLDGNLQWDTTSFWTPGDIVDVLAYNGYIYTGGEFLRHDWDAVMYKFDEDSNLIWYLTYGSYDYFCIYCMDIFEDCIYIGGSGGGNFLMKYDLTLFSDNNKPDTPIKPSGSISGKPGMKYTYYTNTTDLDGDLLSYDFSWGDWNLTTVGWFDSSETVSASYIWNEKGKYIVRIRARDEHGFVSNWSNPLTVSLTKRKDRIINLVFLHFLERFPMLKKLFQILPYISF